MPTISDLLPDYRAALKAHGHEDTGIRRYLGNLRSFAKFAGMIQVSRVTAKLINSFQSVQARDHEPSSLQSSLTSLRSFFAWCIEMEYCEHDPTERIPWAKREETTPRPIHKTVLEGIMQAIETMPDDLTGLQQWRWKRNRLTIFVLFYTGLRISEAAALLWQDVSLTERTMVIRKGKGGKCRTIRLHTALAEELRLNVGPPEHAILPARPAGYPFKRGDLLAKAVFDRWLKPMGFDVTAHRFRHSFATELVRHGVDLESVRQLMGHASLETTQRYLLMDAEWLQQAVDKLPGSWE
jgi:site-specific recombinase XerD